MSTITASDYGRAAHYLERLRLTLAHVRPPILFAGHTLSGSRLGEYRFLIGPKCSVRVRAPVTPRGTPRGGWRYGLSQDQAAEWQTVRTLDATVAGIEAVARQYWTPPGR